MNIDRIIVINLDKSTERLALIQNEFERVGLGDKVERFKAVEHRLTAIGCHESHLEVLKLILKRGYENVLIVEDDFEFVQSKEAVIAALDKFLQTYGDTYDVVTLVDYSVKEFKYVDELVSRLIKSYSAVGYMVNKRILPELIKLQEQALVLHERTGAHWLYANDVIWNTLQSTKNWYIFNKRLGRNRPGMSTISKVFTNPDKDRNTDNSMISFENK